MSKYIKNDQPKAVGGAMPSLQAEELQSAPVLEEAPKVEKPKAEPKKPAGKFDAQGRKILAKKQ